MDLSCLGRLTWVVNSFSWSPGILTWVLGVSGLAGVITAVRKLVP